MRLTHFLLTLLLTPFVHAEVRIVGSDLLGPKVTETLEAFSKRNDLDLKLDLEGSRLGLQQVKTGEADLAIVVFPPDDTLPTAPLVAMPVAYHTAVVVLPNTLPVSQITFEQLNAIYGDDSKSDLKRWNDLGVTGTWSHRNILPTIPGPGGGLTYDIFRYTVLTSPALKPTVSVQPGLRETLARVSGDEGGMAIMPLPPKESTRLKTLLVARGSQDVAFGPTPENLHSGDYPIRLPLYLVFHKESAKRLQLTLRFLLSEDALPMWESANVIPLPVHARNQQIFDLEVL